MKNNMFELDTIRLLPCADLRSTSLQISLRSSESNKLVVFINVLTRF